MRARAPALAPGAALALLATLGLLAGCASAPPLPDRPPPPGVSPEEHVLATLSKDLEGFRTLKASVEGDAPQGSFSGAIFVDRERRAFHLVTWKLGGAIPIFDMLVMDGTLRLCVPRARRLLVRGLAERDPGGGGLPLEALERAVLGPAPGTVTRTALLLGGAHPYWSIAERRVDGVVAGMYSLTPGALAVFEEHIAPASAPDVEVRIDWSDHEPLANGRYAPRALVVRRAGQSDDEALSLRFSDLVWDAPIDARKFEQRLPPETVEVKTFAELELE